MTEPFPAPAVRYEFAVLEWLRDDALLRGAAWVILCAFVAAAVWWYWRERASFRWGTAWLLLLLRLVTLGAVAAMVLGPQRRVAETQTRPSKVAVVVDTSLSMSLNDANRGSADQRSRNASALAILDDSGLLPLLSKDHEVDIRPSQGTGRWRFRAKPPAGEQGPAAETADPAWRQELQPLAAETRLGDALSQVLEDYAGRPLAAVVLLTDGNNNAGRDPYAAAEAFSRRGAALHAIGLGPTTPGANLAVRDLLAPTRAYPKDEIEITALIEVTGTAAAGQASLYRRLEADSEQQAELIDTRPLASASFAAGNKSGDTLSSASIAFTTSPPAVGRYVYTVRLAEVANEIDTSDNHRDVSVEVVDRVLRVLMLAGGPTRDYRFLRDQLRRDDTFEVDVLLQSAGQGAAQDADDFLTAFPNTADEVNAYDVVVAFDPDWRAIGEGGQQRLEEAVSESGAGLLYAPGPVYTPRWLGSREPSRVKALLPVGMPDRWLALSTSSGTSRLRSSVELTSTGAEAEFLWVAGNRTESLQAWRDFPGFYRYFPVQSVKPGAVVYARTEAAVGGDAAAAGTTGVVLAEQFFGAGRVMVLTSSELWRLRRAEPSYFTTLTTKLLQHLAQGRLLANASGGALLFERARYRVGDTVVLRAARIAADVGQPLPVQLTRPDGATHRIELAPSEVRPGDWSASWTAMSAGTLQAILQAKPGEKLTAQAEVNVPAKERSGLVRDADFLRQLTAAGGGYYYPDAEVALQGDGDVPPLAAATPSQAETTVVFGQPDPDFAERISQWALGLIAGCLIAEWLVRRLNRLA